MRVCRDIQSAANDERLAMAQCQTKSDIKPEELADNDITALEAFLRTLTGKTVCKSPFGVLTEVQLGLSVYKYQVCS